MTWNEPMATAYTAGLEDGKAGNPSNVTKGNGFDACYMQGYKHGLSTCLDIMRAELSKTATPHILPAS
jgi:hypothetical protein